MPRYLTVSQYKSADEGIAIANISDLALAQHISHAESDIDAYMGFDMTQGGFDPHRITAQSQHNDRSWKAYLPLSAVPIRKLVEYQIIYGAQSNVYNIDPTAAVVNTTGGYVEIAPLSVTPTSLLSVFTGLGIWPPIAKVTFDVGWSLPAVGDVLYDSGDHQSYVSVRAFWLLDPAFIQQDANEAFMPIPPAVYIDGAKQDPASYTIDADEGRIIFTAADANRGKVTADYVYQIPDDVRDATILQTSYLLGQRAINMQGMSGLETVRSGHQSIKRHLAGGLIGSLATDAASKLTNYVQVPVR